MLFSMGHCVRLEKPQQARSWCLRTKFYSFLTLCVIHLLRYWQSFYGKCSETSVGNFCLHIKVSILSTVRIFKPPTCYILSIIVLLDCILKFVSIYTCFLRNYMLSLCLLIAVQIEFHMTRWLACIYFHHFCFISAILFKFIQNHNNSILISQ